MKNILLFVVLIGAAVSAYAAEVTKHVNRKPAQVSGVITYQGPLVKGSKGAGPVVISGPVADHIYNDMTSITPSTDPGGEKVGRGIVCTQNTDGTHVCTMDFDDVTNGVISPTGPWVWAPAPNL